jgi:hypothetical protein
MLSSNLKFVITGLLRSESVEAAAPDFIFMTAKEHSYKLAFIKPATMKTT